MRPPVVACHPPVLLCRDGGAWAAFEVGPFPYAFASGAERGEILTRTAGALWSAGAEFHLLGLTRTLGRQEALRRLARPEAGPAWAERARAWAGVVEEAGACERVLLLAVRLPEVAASPWEALRLALADVRRAVEEAAGTPQPEPDRDLPARLLQARQVQARLASRLPVHPADGALLAWVLRRPYARGTQEPGPAGEDAPGHLAQAGIAALGEALVDEHLRHLRVETESGAALQAHLVLAHLPSRLPFPGSEWLYLAEEAPFPVDWSVRVRALPAAEARARVERKALELADQDHQLSGGDLPPPLALAEARSDAEELRYRLQATGSPLLFCSAVFCVWAGDEAELERRVEALRAIYAPRGIGLARPTGDQARCLQEACLGGRMLLRDYVQVMPPESLAGAGPFCCRGAGDPLGQLLGFTAGGLRRAVLLDPHLPPLRDRSPSAALVGTLGAGKSFAAKLLLRGALLRGARALVIDPKEEYGGLAGLFREEARVVRLGAGAGACLDPFCFLQADQARAAALSFLTLLLGVPPVSAAGGLLSRALKEIAGSPSPSLSALPQALVRQGEEGRELASHLEVFLTLPLATLAFGKPRGPSLGGKLTVVQTPGLELPDEASLERDLKEGRLAPERRLSLALLYLVAALGQALAAGDRRKLKLLVMDEAWTVVGTPEGRALIERLVRTGRSTNAGVVLITQDARDLPSQVRDNLGVRLAFRAGGEDSARAALSLLGAEETPEHLDLLRSLPTGRCLLRDLDGRVELVEVAGGLPEEAWALDSSPGRGA